ncbi:hypothetical protein [Nocardioides sp. B-3]|uniref:hypothetical protein n=1 Tax=Nocardioides sp. B-3 TaxID=2895565 RepID=UPI0021535CEE|nr:hypothetical protein [Nocardioides sp. B-3]UUZ58918.1 hypothetical protein LP418_23120 [Nocardioides sp. B-3]
MRKLLLGLHATFIVLVVPYYVASITIYATPDANIGAGLGIMATGAAGLPWSWPLLNGTCPSARSFFFPAATAPVNLVLHWAIGAWLARRSSREM